MCASRKIHPGDEKVAPPPQGGVSPSQQVAVKQTTQESNEPATGQHTKGVVLVKHGDKHELPPVPTTPVGTSGENIPENVPIAPPPKDPYDDTLRGVKSLEAENSKSFKVVEPV